MSGMKDGANIDPFADDDEDEEEAQNEEVTEIKDADNDAGSESSQPSEEAHDNGDDQPNTTDSTDSGDESVTEQHSQKSQTETAESGSERDVSGAERAAGSQQSQSIPAADVDAAWLLDADTDDRGVVQFRVDTDARWEFQNAGYTAVKKELRNIDRGLADLDKWQLQTAALKMLLEHPEEWAETAAELAAATDE
ncbi:hypothetical protein [Halovenus sp. HT40]|uniref:hypothetical protein n=1 Tax=Halovenus sp. HT40 TaxID=3126691 RepID=UPI00300F439E